jgi:hypothetical protein
MTLTSRANKPVEVPKLDGHAYGISRKFTLIAPAVSNLAFSGRTSETNWKDGRAYGVLEVEHAVPPQPRHVQDFAWQTGGLVILRFSYPHHVCFCMGNRE